MNKKQIQRLKLIIAVSVVLIAIVAVIIMNIRYQKEGEKNMPYSVSKIIIVSTANKLDTSSENSSATDGSNGATVSQENATDENSNNDNTADNQSSENTDESTTESDNSVWSFDVVQNSDVYMSIEKNSANIKDNEKLKNVTIENIQVNERPVKGTLKAYMPSSLENTKFSYIDSFTISNSLTYRAAAETSPKNLQVSENGGTIEISFANKDLGKYVSGEDTEVTFDGKLLSKIGVTDDDVKAKVSFDLVIELDNGKKYSGNISLDLNCQDLVENGQSTQEITDFSDVIFKRI